jgi:TonB-dependent receptor-like protein
MPHFRSLPHLVALSVLALGCKTSRPFDRTTQPGGRPLSRTTTGSLIITGRALSADPGRTVLDAIRHQMPQLRIAGWTQYNRCPLLEMRGKDSVEGTNNPDVYVDGTRTTDTCPLVAIQAVQTERIEVYPMGMTSRPGYPSSGHGLILIFLARADTAADST